MTALYVAIVLAVIPALVAVAKVITARTKNKVDDKIVQFLADHEPEILAYVKGVAEKAAVEVSKVPAPVKADVKVPHAG